MNKEISWITKKLSQLANSFFAINSLGWFGLFIFNVATRYTYLETIDDWLGFSSFYIVGCLVSFLLRIFYKIVARKTEKLINIGLFVFITSFFFGNIWFYADLAVSIGMFGFERFQDIFQFPNLLLRTFLPWLIMLVWSSLYFIVRFWRQWVIEKNRARDAEILLQESELKLLRYQINPHFLFNSLNSIRALTLKDPSMVRGMVTELSEFLKYSLLTKNNREVSLEKELESIKHYIRIEKYRFDENLLVEYDIDQFAEEYPVPVMLLHPIVDNAVKHGMKTSEMPLRISITAKVVNDELRIEIANSGKWLESSIDQLESSNGTNTGLENVRKRLENSYGKEYRFDIEKRVDEVVVKIQLKKHLEDEYEKEA